MDDDDTIPDGPSNMDKSEDERTEYETGTTPEPETQKFLSPSTLTDNSNQPSPSPMGSSRKINSGGLRLSDSVSVVSAEEILQRREALKLFSSQLSMASTLATGRSASVLQGVSINYELTPFSSTLSSLNPLCRICQCPAEANNVLITPCRCDGSLKHIHATCLLVRYRYISTIF